MNQEEILGVLEAISAGEAVAEHETGLPDVFIADIEIYRRLVNDEVDVVTGGKGSGKSAIYRMITETRIAEDLKVLPGSNPTGAPEFRALFTGRDSEERLRSIWAVYLASLIGNHVVDTYSDKPPVSKDVNEVREILELMGLRRKKKNSGPSLLQRIRKASSVEGQVKGGVAGLELGVGLKFELPDGTSDAVGGTVLEYPDFYELIKKCADILASHNFRLWIAIDRLDECFLRNSEGERRALRALMRTMLDCAQALQYTPTIRIKAFLRADMFTKFTEDGAFTNATHLRRNDISWTFNSMADLIAHRVIKDEGFAKHYLAGTADADYTRAIWNVLFPNIGRRRPGKRDQRYTTSEQLCLSTADGSHLYNPRNLISLINLAVLRARENQRRALAMGRASRSSRPLIAEGEVQAALGELARQRLQDTVLNEFPSVAPFADKLMGGSAEYENRGRLVTQLGLSGSDAGLAAEAINALLLSGLVGQLPGGRFAIPWLYRPAIRSTRRLNGKS